MPGWAWEAHEKSGKRVTGWTGGTQIATRELLIAHLMVHYHALDYSEFKCEPCEQPPDSRKPAPVSWFEFGTTRFRQEIDAGLRPFSEYLQPPLDLRKPIKLTPTSQSKLAPTRRI